MATKFTSVPSQFASSFRALEYDHPKLKPSQKLTYPWTTVRSVSQQLKKEIEDIFRTEHLSKTWLHLDTGESSCAYTANPEGGG